MSAGTIEQVVLVNERDEAIGTMEKMAAHEQGLLHRAFSIFVFNSRGEMLIHQRAHEKYHSGGLWTNACCSHPRPGETVLEAGHRRLEEEMGMACDLTPQFTFMYKRALDQGLTEHEYDHVLFGVTDVQPVINPAEVADFRYVTIADLEVDIAAHPDHYTEWFKICLAEVLSRRQR